MDPYMYIKTIAQGCVCAIVAWMTEINDRVKIK